MVTTEQAEQLWEGWAAVQGWALTYQDKVVHDVLTELQAGGTRHFQEQVASCLLNLKNWISEKNSYWCWASSRSMNSEGSVSRATEGWRCQPALD